MRRLRRGQAMVETVLAVLIVSAVFFGLFRLSRLLAGKILLEHAAMRVARARAVGFNDFMCRKAARVSVIPVAGKRLWPDPVPVREQYGKAVLKRAPHIFGFIGNKRRRERSADYNKKAGKVKKGHIIRSGHKHRSGTKSYSCQETY